MKGRCHIILALSLVLGSLSLAGCDSSSRSAKRPDEVMVAEVNGEAITLADLNANLLAGGQAGMPEKNKKKLLRTLVGQLVERRLMLQRFRQSGDFVDENQVRAYIDAVARGYGPRGLEGALKDEGIDRQKWEQALRETLEIEQLLEREVYAKVQVTEKELKEYYDRHLDRYRLPKRLRVRQIVVATEEEAKRLRVRILEGASFAVVAQKKSLGPERVRGGDLGFFAEGELPESIEDVIKYLKDGEVSRPVRTASGFHLLQVTERRSAGLQPFETVHDKVREDVVSQKGRRRLAQWLAELKKNAVIRYYWRNLENVGTG